MGLAEIRERWLSERPRYERLADTVKLSLERRLHKDGIAGQCFARAKDLGSLLKKVLLRGVLDSTYEALSDRAGVRVVVTYPDSVPGVEAAIEDTLDVRKKDDKRLTRRVNELSYFGIHYDVCLRPPLATDLEEMAGLPCEVQIQTRASNLWSDVAHQLAYKSAVDASPETRRSIYRLMALVEIFDETIEKARDTIMNTLGYEERSMLSVLEPHYYRYAGRPFSADLSLRILATLKGLLPAGQTAAFARTMENFAAAHEQKLRVLYEAYRADERCSPLLFQPEALFVFEELERDPFQLKDTWVRQFDLDLLEELAMVWGRPLS